MKKNLAIALASWLLMAGTVAAQNVPITQANYHLPSQFSPNKLRTMVFSTSVDAHWLKSGDRFWYEYETSQGKTYYIVDAAKIETSAFDNVKWLQRYLLTGDPLMRNIYP